MQLRRKKFIVGALIFSTMLTSLPVQARDCEYWDGEYECSDLDGDKVYDSQYQLVSGEYLEIEAKEIEGRNFDKWSIVSGDGVFTDSESRVTYVIMQNTDLYISPLYTKIVQDNINVYVDKNGDGIYNTTYVVKKNSSVSFTADDKSGYEFDKWVVTSGDIAKIEEATSKTVKLTVKETDVKIQATYNKKVPESTYKIYIDADGDNLYESSAEGIEGTKFAVSISDREGYKFNNWSIVSGDIGISDVKSKSITITVKKSDAKIKANYQKEEVFSYKTCNVNITCAPFLDDCSASIRDRLPLDGVILGSTVVEYKDGDTVYDVLKRVCESKGIQYSAKETSYGAYVSSVDNLSEKYYDSSTGWMYFVNGSDPGVSSSSLVVTEGMNITWSYDAWSF